MWPDLRDLSEWALPQTPRHSQLVVPTHLPGALPQERRSTLSHCVAKPLAQLNGGLELGFQKRDMLILLPSGFKYLMHGLGAVEPPRLGRPRWVEARVVIELDGHRVAAARREQPAVFWILPVRQQGELVWQCDPNLLDSPMLANPEGGGRMAGGSARLAIASWEIQKGEVA